MLGGGHNVTRGRVWGGKTGKEGRFMKTCDWGDDDSKGRVGEWKANPLSGKLVIDDLMILKDVFEKERDVGGLAESWWGRRWCF